VAKSNSLVESFTESPFLPKLPTLKDIPLPYLLGGGYLAFFLVLLIMVKASKSRGNGKRPMLGRARKAKKSEWQKSQFQVVNNIVNTHRKKNFSSFGGWIGKPERIHNFPNRVIPYFGMTSPRIALDRINEHLLILASSGAGKSYSVFDPLIRSLILQNFSVGFFDFKGDQEDDSECCPSSELAGYALQHGYKVRVVAPGYADSDVINLLDFVHDTESAGELSEVLYANINKGKQASDDGFFPIAGKLAMQFVFLWAKWQPRKDLADLALCHKVLSLPNLLERLLADKQIPQKIKIIAQQLISTAGSLETAASIIATTLTVLTKFMNDASWMTFNGVSTMPIVTGHKEFVIYRMNPLYEKTLAPLMASVIHMQLRLNTYSKRGTKYPFCMAMDEFPRILIPAMPGQMADARSKKVCYLLAAQSHPNIEATYGKLALEEIMANAKTLFLGQLNCDRTIKHYSESFGKEDIVYKTFSDSTQKGQMMGGSSSDNNNLTTRDLVPFEALKEADQGIFYMRSPGTKGKVDGERKSQMLYKVNIRPGKKEHDEANRAKADWFKFRNKRLRNPVAKTLTEDDLAEREEYANNMLPMPKANKKSAFQKLMK
jgi:type IV secretory pathway TraG/TraD family ATPase VirD4